MAGPWLFAIGFSPTTVVQVLLKIFITLETKQTFALFRQSQTNRINSARLGFILGLSWVVSKLLRDFLSPLFYLV